MGGAESREAAAATETATRHSMPSVSSSPPQAALPSSGTSSSAGRAPSASVGHDARATAVERELEAGGIERGQEATEEATKELSYWYLLKHGYNELVHLIIRPPRARYDPAELGPARFEFAGREFARDDFVVRNDREQGLKCSLWHCASVSSTTDLLPCVVYLHGNSSCRLEALGVLRTCLAAGASVAAFDCSGCGLSDGEYISLGFFERDDLRSVIDHLRAHCRVGAVALWGRSMGAATALLHADRDPSIAGIIVDSAFTDLDALVQEVVERGRQEGLTLPKLLVKLVMKFVRSSVQKRAHFDIKKLAPIDHAAASFVPALFVAAEDDSFIAPHHSDRLYERYGGDKNIVKVDGDHNSARPQFLLDSAGIFLQAALQIDPLLVPDLTLVTSSSSGRRRRHRGNRPPWESSASRRRRASTSSASSARGFASPLSADARFSGKDSMLAPMEPWPCPSCTYINAPLRIQVGRLPGHRVLVFKAISNL